MKNRSNSPIPADGGKKMEMIVVGCGRVGAELALRLYEHGHKVAIVDHDGDAFRNLAITFRGRTIEGEALNQDVLFRAGIETADGLAAVSNSDTLNVAVAHLARTVYHVPNVVVRNYDSRWRSLYEAFDLQVISSASWGAQRLEELLISSELKPFFSAGNGEVGLYEVIIPPLWNGRGISELLPAEGVILSALSRGGRAVLPNGIIQLQQGDVILLSATEQGIETLRQKLDLG